MIFIKLSCLILVFYFSNSDAATRESRRIRADQLGNPAAAMALIEDEFEYLDSRPPFNQRLYYEGEAYQGVLDAEQIPRHNNRDFLGRIKKAIQIPAGNDIIARLTIVAKRNNAANTISKALVERAFRYEQLSPNDIANMQAGKKVDLKVHVTITNVEDNNLPHISHTIVIDPDNKTGI